MGPYNKYDPRYDVGPAGAIQEPFLLADHVVIGRLLSLGITCGASTL